MLKAFGILFILVTFPMASQQLFPPDKIKREINAIKVDTPIFLDGILDEDSWDFNSQGGNFTQKDPVQGAPARLQTSVCVLYTEKYLYFGAKCALENGRADIQVPDLKRDFEFGSCDTFGVSIDAFGDDRNAQVFEVNPFGVLSDRLVSDGATNNPYWDGIWQAKTTIDKDGWYIEMQIPWETLRYSETENGHWGINFHRITRKGNEISSWAPVPRALEVTQMQYAGIVSNLEVKPPSLNMRLQPYYTASLKKSVSEGNDENAFTNDIGGEVKWGITANTVLDLTFNTDFAQADVDRQVVNLSRFSVFFPEKRQFFLENSSIFEVGKRQQLEPFFSRSIGLDKNGQTIPIDFGIRLTKRNVKESFGAMVVKQHQSNISPDAYFSVGSFARNFGKLSKIGVMVTSKIEQGQDSVPNINNYTGTLSGLFGFTNAFSLKYAVSGSLTSGQGGEGVAATTRLLYRSNDIYTFVNIDAVDNEYTANAGFVGRHDYYSINPGIIYIYRGSLLPAALRSFEPGVYYTHIRQLNSNALLEGTWSIYPIFINFNDGMTFSYEWSPSFQNIQEAFSPIGISIEPGDYTFSRHTVEVVSNSAAKLSGAMRYSWGGFYNGKLDDITLSLAIAPIPYTSLSINYQYTHARNLGSTIGSTARHLVGPEIRLALNPFLQLNAFYQVQFDNNDFVKKYNRLENLNFRLSWEFKPRSFVYFILNDYNNQILIPEVRNGGLIGKITYIKQF
jgi:hypothetical protein